MKKILLLSVFLSIFLVGCSEKTTSGKVTTEDVQLSLIEQGIAWEKDEDQLAGGLFSFPLNNVEPITLSHEENILTIYEYDSKKERKNAVKLFEEGTATMDLVSHTMYEEGNVLLFYVYYDESNYDEKIHKSIKGALKSL